MQPHAEKLIEIAGITTPLVGFYDVPDTQPFAPFVTPRHCFFSAYANWQNGESVVVTRETFRCKGAGYWLCGVASRPREAFADFLANEEGLKASTDLMEQWLDHQKPYQQIHPYIVIGPLKAEQYAYLRTVTFFVNPDQLSLLLTGAEYHSARSGALRVVSKFGSGCSQLAAVFDDFDQPQAIISTTDIAMRRYLPADILALTVTRPMFAQLCELDEDSFLFKPFWKRLKKARTEQPAS